MENSLSVRFHRVFGLVVLLELASNFFIPSFPWFHFLAKPMVLIVLSGYYYLATKGGRTRQDWIIQAALFFSWCGDVLLMFEPELFFLLGLSAFLLAQLSYIFAFRLDIAGKTGMSLLRQQPWSALPLLMYLGGLWLLIVWTLGPMLIPVALYSLVILGMVLMALNRMGFVPRKSFTWVMIGALLFMLSDSLIAVNKFAFTIPFSKTLIMTTYIAAQYLIVQGMLFRKAS